jgi:hypothetical protein
MVVFQMQEALYGAYSGDSAQAKEYPTISESDIKGMRKLYGSYTSASGFWMFFSARIPDIL